MTEVPQTSVGDAVEEGVVVDGDRVISFSFPATAAPPTNTRSSRGPALAPPTPITAAPPPTANPREEAGPELPSTFTAHADIEARAMVATDEEFLVAIGLSADPVAETLGAGIFIEDVDDDSPTLNIDVHRVGDLDIVGSGVAARTIEVDRATMDHMPVALKVKARSGSVGS